VICFDPVQAPFTNLPWKLLPDEFDKDVIKNQWIRLQTTGKDGIFGNEDIDKLHILDFWLRVQETTNALGEPVFNKLAEFAILCLSLPISNGVVERVFSIMNVVKNKLRNRMGVKMLNAILYVRCFCYVRKTCCNKFIPTAKMYLLHNNDMYPRRKNQCLIQQIGMTKKMILRGMVSI